VADGNTNDVGANDGNSTTPGSGNTRSITVSNTGEAKGEPDLAIVQVAVQTTAENAEDVRADLAQRAEDVRTALLEFGLAEDAITTRRFRIDERLDRRQMEKDGVRPSSREEAEKYMYYEGTHSFTVEVDDIDQVGGVIDTAVGAGADEIDRVTFTLSEERRATLREEALKKALQNARSEAETIASEVGASIVEADVVDASDARVSPVRREFAAGGDGAGMPTEEPAPSTGVEPGDITVRAEVYVKYEMA
jgi:uncharacterized protein YggE